MPITELELLSQLRDYMVQFLDELISAFPDQPDFVIFRIFIKDRIPMEDVMIYIVNQLLPLKEQVDKRDEKFFLDHNILFGNFDQKKTDKINHFREMWRSDEMDNENRDAIWRWFSAFLSIANKYVSLNKPSNVSPDEM